MFDEDFDNEDDELSEREYAARGEFNSTQVQLRELLEGAGARRVEVECGGVEPNPVTGVPAMASFGDGYSWHVTGLTTND